MIPDSVTKRLALVNSFLATTPYRPKLYFAGDQLHLFIDRMGTGFANVDIPVFINYGNGCFMRSRRSAHRANLPWGSTQEQMISGLCTWVTEGHPWRDGYWERMVSEHSHWLDGEAVRQFLAVQKGLA